LSFGGQKFFDGEQTLEEDRCPKGVLLLVLPSGVELKNL
jgi:hypothetical protein